MHAYMHTYTYTYTTIATCNLHRKQSQAHLMYCYLAHAFKLNTHPPPSSSAVGSTHRNCSP